MDALSFWRKHEDGVSIQNPTIQIKHHVNTQLSETYTFYINQLVYDLDFGFTSKNIGL